MYGLSKRIFLFALTTSVLAVASTSPVPVAGLATRLGKGLDASAIFDTASGESAAVRPDRNGETADRWHTLTALTLQTDLGRPDFAVAMGEASGIEKPVQPLISYLAGVERGESLTLSREQRVEIHGAPGQLCLLCAPGTTPSAGARLDLAADPFEPILYAAVGLPPTPLGDGTSEAPITTASLQASPGSIRLAAFVIPPDMPKRNSLYFFACGGLLLLLARFRRLGRAQKR